MILLSTIKPNPSNPRIISEKDFARLCTSIREFPAMMALRPMVVDAADNVILGGNMRYKALLQLGYVEIPDNWIIKSDKLTSAQKEEFLIKDNAHFGSFDWDTVCNSWDTGQLVEWGVNLPVWDEEHESGISRRVMITCPECSHKWKP